MYLYTPFSFICQSKRWFSRLIYVYVMLQKCLRRKVSGHFSCLPGFWVSAHTLASSPCGLTGSCDSAPLRVDRPSPQMNGPVGDTCNGCYWLWLYWVVLPTYSSGYQMLPPIVGNGHGTDNRTFGMAPIIRGFCSRTVIPECIVISFEMPILSDRESLSDQM